MRIEWIEVENFKGFDKRRFEFDEHFTLIVGENGAGKTSALTAAKLVGQLLVSAIRWQGAKVDEVVLRKEGNLLGGVLSFEPCLPLVFRCRIILDGKRYPVNCQAESEQMVEKLLQEPLRVFHDYHQGCISSTASHWPVFSMFTAGRRLSAQGSSNWDKMLNVGVERKTAYDRWDFADEALGDLIDWLGLHEAVKLQEGSEARHSVLTRKAMSGALPGALNIWFSLKHRQLVIQFADGKLRTFDQLPDGQRSIIAIVGDLARRAVLANPSADDPVAEATGVVLIDEIDLHLHPRWQRRIMEDLRRVFPKIQFIATTHSPIIISAAKDAKIICLDADGSREIPQAYGMDVNWIVEAVQGAESQAPEVVALIRRIEDLIEEARLDEARQLIPELEKLQNGPSPDSVRLDAEMDNLIALANAED